MFGQVLAVRRLSPNEVALTAHDLVHLQRSTYRVEAELMGDVRIPQLTQAPSEVVAEGLHWDVVEIAGRLIAAAAHSEGAGSIDVERLIVHPDWHRKGLGRQLVSALPPGPATVSIGRDNQPARRLYEGRSFQHVEDEQVLPGLWVSTYRG